MNREQMDVEVIITSLPVCSLFDIHLLFLFVSKSNQPLSYAPSPAGFALFNTRALISATTKPTGNIST